MQVDLVSLGVGALIVLISLGFGIWVAREGFRVKKDSDGEG